MTSSIVPAKTAFSRVFLIEGGARADRRPTFEAFMKAGPLEWGVGDSERLESPDPEAYGQFIEIGQIEGQVERPTTSLVGRYAADVASKMLEFARRRCPFDIHIHFGQCTDPTAFDSYTKAVVFEAGRPTNFATEDLGALGSDENAKIDETLDVSGRDAYEVLPLSVSEKAGSIVTNEVVGGVICDSKACDDCQEGSDGAEKIYVVTKAAGGSPSTPPDVVYTLDKGLNYAASDVDSLSSSQDPSGIGCVGDYIVVISAAVGTTGNLNYVLKSELAATGDETWVGVTTGFVAGKQPRAISVANNTGFIVGNGGYVYKCVDPAAGVEVLDAGTFQTDDLLAVHALTDEFVVAAGNNGVVIWTENGVSFSQITRFTALGVHFKGVWAKNEREWFVVTNGGRLYYTINSGVSWTEKSFPSSGSGECQSIRMINNDVGYMTHTQASSSKGRVLRTSNSGNTWVVTPERLGMPGVPTNQRLNFVLANKHDVNFYVAGGLGVSTDGILIQAED